MSLVNVTELSNLNAYLLKRIEEFPEFIAYKFLDNQGNLVDEINYISLFKKAYAISKKIHNIKVESKKIILFFSKNIDFICALFGVWHAECIAIPFSSPIVYNKNDIQNLIRLLDKTKTKTIFTTKAIYYHLLNLIVNEPALNTINFLFLEENTVNQDDNNTYLTSKTNPPALMLETSQDETSEPSIVVHNHTDILRHLIRMNQILEINSQDCMLSLAPNYHYLGLFYGILLPFYANVCGFLSLSHFPFSPFTWLNSISKYKISIAGGATFFFHLCNTMKENKIDKNINLSSWRKTFISGEIIDDEIINHFYLKLKKFGFKKTSMLSIYGMAEIPLISAANLIIDENLSLRILNKEINHDHVTKIMTSGTVIKDIDLKIINQDNHQPCQNGEIGIIHIFDKEQDGYHGNSEVFINTQDIGFKKSGLLYVLGKEQYSETKKIPQKSDIAIIGLAGIFPQSDNYWEFWQHLENGDDLITEIPKNRWDWKEIYGTPNNQNKKTDIKWGGFINDVGEFDASFFNISPKEAQLMDPMQRKLIQIIWQAVEDAGYRISEFSGKKVGIFIGIGTFDYLQLIMENNEFNHAYAATGAVHCMAANRISFLFNFKGPSESIDTACSSSLVALHRAISLMKSNECEIAIVAGANLLLSSEVYVTLSNAGMLSKSGKCSTFDDAADGYVRGEGIAAIVLKKLDAAIADNDNIHALIKGIAVNHGGHTSSLTAPNPFMQSLVIEDALKNAFISADTISYMETHGTGTALGDPIEIEGLISAFKNSTKDFNKIDDAYCGLGSVKTNIGHLEAAAGIAGVIKVLMSMKNQKIPGHLHLKKINKNISLKNTPFFIGNQTEEWKPLQKKNGESIPRRAGVSSFGFGGVNSHVVLEEFNRFNLEDQSKFDSNIFIFSAKTEASLTQYIQNFIHFLKKNPEKLNLDSIAYTLQIGRELFDFRLAVVAHHKEDLLMKLTHFLSEDNLKSNKKFDSIFYYKIEGEYANIIFGSNRKDITDLANYYLTQKNWNYLAQLWILGSEIDWQSLYTKKSHVRRISLPPYSFEKTSHWINLSEKKQEQNSQVINDAYDLNWYELPLSNHITQKEVAYILFCDTYGVGQKFYELLIHKNISACKINYDSISKNNYLTVLIEAIEKSSHKIFYIINFWPIDINYQQEISPLKQLKNNYEFSCQAAFEQMQALLVLPKELTCYYWILTANVQNIDNKKINLDCAPLWGMAKTALLELPTLVRSIIDIDLTESVDVEQLYKEFMSLSNEGEIVYRKGTRYVARLVLREFRVSQSLKINLNGSYLITGGLGGVGLLITDWLSSFKVKKILIVSRRKYDSNLHDETIDLIKKKGVEIEIIQADITNLDQMKAVKRNFIKGNELRGIFHLAGSYKENTIQNMTLENFKDVAAAKVEGTWVLHKVFKICQLDCFVIFSSGASVWGAATGSHYSAGNYFTDKYAEYAEIQGLPVTNINWGGIWETRGLIPIDKEEYFKSIGVKVTTVKEGLRILECTMSIGHHRKIIAPIEWPLFIEVMNTKRHNTLFDRMKNINSKVVNNKENSFSISFNSCGSKQEKYNFLISVLKKLLINILSLTDKTDLNEHTGFFNIGMDSLTAIDYRKNIQNFIGIDINTVALFDYNTLDSLTNFILITYFAENDAPHEINANEKSNLDPQLELDNLDNIETDELLKFLKLELEIESV